MTKTNGKQQLIDLLIALAFLSLIKQLFLEQSIYGEHTDLFRAITFLLLAYLIIIRLKLQSKIKRIIKW